MGGVEGESDKTESPRRQRQPRRNGCKVLRMGFSTSGSQLILGESEDPAGLTWILQVESNRGSIGGPMCPSIADARIDQIVAFIL